MAAKFRRRKSTQTFLRLLTGGLCVLTMGCTQTGDSFEGGLFGWNPRKSYQRIQDRERSLNAVGKNPHLRTNNEGALLGALIGANFGYLLGGLPYAEETDSKAIRIGGTLAGSINSAPFGTLTKDGKIRSPYAKDCPAVPIPNVLEKGNLMKCPYTKNFFRVPPVRHAPKKVEEEADLPSSGAKKDGAIKRWFGRASATPKAPAKSAPSIQNDPPKLRE